MYNEVNGNYNKSFRGGLDMSSVGGTDVNKLLVGALTTVNSCVAEVGAKSGREQEQAIAKLDQTIEQLKQNLLENFKSISTPIDVKGQERVTVGQAIQKPEEREKWVDEHIQGLLKTAVGRITGKLPSKVYTLAGMKAPETATPKPVPTTTKVQGLKDVFTKIPVMGSAHPAAPKTGHKEVQEPAIHPVRATTTTATGSAVITPKPPAESETIVKTGVTASKAGVRSFKAHKDLSTICEAITKTVPNVTVTLHSKKEINLHDLVSNMKESVGKNIKTEDQPKAIIDKLERLLKVHSDKIDPGMLATAQKALTEQASGRGFKTVDQLRETLDTSLVEAQKGAASKKTELLKKEPSSFGKKVGLVALSAAPIILYISAKVSCDARYSEAWASKDVAGLEGWYRAPSHCELTPAGNAVLAAAIAGATNLFRMAVGK